MSNKQSSNPFDRNQRIRNKLSQQTYGYLETCEPADNIESLILGYIHYVDEIVKSLPQLELPLFRPEPNQRKHSEYTLKRTPHADKIINALELIPKLYYLYPDHEFTPYVESFLLSAYRFDLEGITNDKITSRETIDRLNDFIEDVIGRLRSPEFRRQRQRCQENVNKNAKSLRNYIDALFDYRPRLLVIRLDFGYKTRLLSNPECALDPQDVIHDKERLIRYTKRLLEDSLVGYAWKLEHGVLKSYHFHMVFFLNGRDRRSDAYIGRQLGKYWVDIITQGQGTTFNCNADKKAYSELAIGMVHYTDDQKRQFLVNHVVSYLTKNDDSMRLKIKVQGKQIRTFGKGEIPTDGGVTRRGRRRKMIE